MNIVLDCERMKYEHTGLFEYCLQLGNSLQRLCGSNDQIQYYIREDNKKYFDIKSNFLAQHSLHKFFFPRYSNIDLWHVSHQNSIYIPRSPKIKKVITIHDLNFLYEEKSSGRVKDYLRRVQKNVDQADAVIAISEFTKNDILEHIKLQGKSIDVIYNGCSEAILTPGTEPNYKPATNFLFCLGTITPKKNFHVLTPLLINNDYELIVAGRVDESYKNKIIAEAKKYNVADRVKIVGPISTQEKLWYYKNCQAFLFPSIAEGFGIPPIEAMRFGKPTFLSDRTSLPEIGGKHAYYFKSFDPEQMQIVFNTGMEHYSKHLPISEIIAHANQFSWQNTAVAYLDVYKNILNG